MKEKKKIMLGIGIIVTLLIVAVGVTYAAFVYRETTTNQQLVLGDIYMYYNETNQLSIDNMVPTNIANYTTYVVNPIMASQTVDNETELARCFNFFIEVGLPFDEGSDAESYCKGTGTAMNMTFQGVLDMEQQNSGSNFLESGGQQLFDLGLIILENDYYIVNPVMATQNLNELTRCVNYLNNARMSLEDGSTIEEFCQGTGTAENGYTFQENIDIEGWFPTEVVTFFKNGNILTTKIENLPYFEFTVSGKNEYNEKDIYYEVILNHGDTPDDKLETNRIKDSSLRFRLAKVNNDNTETELFNERKYSDVANKTIWVETIKANTDDEISNKYRLYMWIDEDVTICGGEITSGCDYYTSGDTNNWNDVFASVKVGVKGDFNEKELPLEPTDESCFEATVENNEATITFYDNSCGTEVVIPSTINGYSVTVIGSNAFENAQLTSVKIPDSVTTIGSAAFFQNYLTNVEIPDSVVYIGAAAFAQNPLKTVVIGKNTTHIEENAFVTTSMYHVVPQITSVTIKGKTSVEEFETYPIHAFGWAEGYSDDDIVFINE